MLGSTHFYFRLTLLTFFALVFSAGSPAQSVLPGQFQGVPTTPFHGVPAVPFQGVPNAGGLNSSLGRQGANYFNQGAFGYASPFLGNCCNDFVSPSAHSQRGSHPPFRTEHRHRRRDDSTYVVPAYIPYAVPYGVEDDDVTDDYDGAQALPDLDYSQSRHISKEAAHRSVQASGASGNGGPAVGPEYPDEDAIDAPGGSFSAKDCSRKPPRTRYGAACYRSNFQRWTPLRGRQLCDRGRYLISVCGRPRPQDSAFRPRSAGHSENQRGSGNRFRRTPGERSQNRVAVEVLGAPR